MIQHICKEKFGIDLMFQNRSSLRNVLSEPFIFLKKKCFNQGQYCNCSLLIFSPPSCSQRERTKSLFHLAMEMLANVCLRKDSHRRYEARQKG